MIKGISIKNYKEIDGHDDSRAFSADIYMEGFGKIAHTYNDGWGGCNDWDFFRDGDAQTRFALRVKQYAQEKNDNLMDADIFVESLILDKEIQGYKKKNTRNGFPITVICRRGKKVYEELGTTMWDKEWVMGIKSEESLTRYIKKEQIEECERV